MKKNEGYPGMIEKK